MQILQEGQKSNYHRVEQLANQFGLPPQEATHLASVSKLENKLAKHQKQVRAEKNMKINKGEGKFFEKPEALNNKRIDGTDLQYGY